MDGVIAAAEFNVRYKMKFDEFGNSLDCKLYLQAREKYDAGHYEEAISLFK